MTSASATGSTRDRVSEGTWASTAASAMLWSIESINASREV
jgi:hypothetical protein